MSSVHVLAKLEHVPILILVTQYEPAGAQRVALSQAHYLHQQGYPVLLCFFYDKSGGLPELAHTCPFPVIDLGARPLGVGKIGQVRATLGACVRLLRLLKHHKIGVFLTLTHYSNVLGMPLAWLAGVPIRIASQRNTLSEFPAWFWRLDAAIVNSPLTSRMVAVSQETRRFCIEVEGMHPEKIVVIPNGVVAATFDRTRWSADVIAQLRGEFGIHHADPLILTIARLHPQKGHHFLIDAIPSILARHPTARFVFVGDGDWRDQIEAQIAAQGLNKHVFVVGRRNDIPQLLAAADLFVLPSISEGMPNAVLEAMAAGTPVVATAVDGTRELITDGMTGRLVPPQQPAPLAAAINEFLDNPAMRATLANQALECVRAEFDEHAMHALLENLIITTTQQHQAKQHRVTSAGTAVVQILGVDVHALTVAELHTALDKIISSRSKAMVLHANVHGLNLACREAWLRRMLNRADIVFCDGAGVMVAARILGAKIPERITYADWIWQLADFAAQKGHSIFLLGAQPGIAEQAAAALMRHAPGLQIAGTHHGYFDKTPGSAENSAVVATINATRPDILIVSLGMPLQERWIDQNWADLQISVALSAGAALDYASGSLRRGPAWLTGNGMEWLARLIIEPRRLWRRYVLGNPLFIARVAAQRLGRRYDD